MPLPAGARFGPYEIIAPLGAGGMGEVYRARDARLGATSRSRSCPSTFAADPDALARFEREARAVAALSHPNILAIHDVGHATATAYAVMELLEGETLRERLARAPLPPRKAIEYRRRRSPAASAAAHDKGIVHRDLKPENIFLTRRRPREDSRLRSGAADAPPRRPRPRLRATMTRARRPTRARCSAPSATCRPSRCAALPADHRSDIFSLRRRALRDARGPARVRRRQRRRDDERDPEGGPARAHGRRRALPPALERIVAALPREGAGRALPVGARSRVRIWKRCAPDPSRRVRRSSRGSRRAGAGLS